jgi:formylglycine-generating enzyme required for sulfatase activity
LRTIFLSILFFVVPLFLFAEEPKAGTIKIVGDIEFVFIPKGCFIMGSPKGGGTFDDERPQHKVCLDSFWMSKYEITIGQYLEYLNGGGDPSTVAIDEDLSPIKISGEKYVLSENKHGNSNELPMTYVSRYGVLKFTKWFSSKHNVKASIPTEAQWEYACRAGTTTLYYWGDHLDGDYLWYEANSNNRIHKVGQKKPNAWGLYDMQGNVEEFCLDYYDENYYRRSPVKNPVNKTRRKKHGNSFVSRGGLAFFDKYYYFYSSARSQNAYDDDDSGMTPSSGIRMVLLDK